MKILIKNVITIETGENNLVNVVINDKKISDVLENIEDLSSFDKIIDGNGKYLLPGLIDMNCEICDPGYDYKEDMESISKSAIKSGFTSLTCSPNTKPVIDNKVVVKYVSFVASENAIVNIFPYGHMTVCGAGLELSEIGEMISGGIVGISDGNRGIKDNYLLKNIFSYSNMFKIPVITFCEDDVIKNDGIINNGKASFLTGLKGIPASAEEVVVAKNLILAGEMNAKLHITKITTKGSVNLIRIAKSMGINVTCDTAPHYTCFTENKVFDYNTNFKVRPPLRSDDDVSAIIEGLNNGTIDAISTSHDPENNETKRCEFESASFGVSGLEYAFIVTYNKLVKTNYLTLNKLIEKFAINPYSILNISNKGKIQKGYDADVFLFNPNRKTTILSKNFESKAKYSMYEGEVLDGYVELTLVSGNIVFEDFED